MGVGLKILIVDDERWIRKGIAKMIQAEELGIEEILEADGVKSGWEQFRKHNPEIVISDVKFPTENGSILCDRIYSACPNTKIIMISGYDEFEYVKAALQYRALDYLLKPIDKDVLNKTIRRAGEELNQIHHRKQQQDKQEKERMQALKGEEIVKELMCELQEHYNEKITLGELAARYYVNESYLSNLFTRTAGMSLMNYLMKVRVEKAKTLLMMSRLSITNIAEKVGYENMKYFTRVFKKITGETPKDYRLRMEQELKE